MQKNNTPVTIALVCLTAFLSVLLAVVVTGQNSLSAQLDVSVSNGQTASMVLYPLSPSDIMNVDGTELSSPSLGNANSWIGSGKNSSSSLLAIRFPGENIPAGAQVTSAKIGFTVASEQWINVAVDLFAEKSANPDTFSRESSPLTRQLTTAKGTYSKNERWLARQYYDLDVTAPVKEALAQAGNKGVVIVAKNTSKTSWSRKFIFADITNKLLAPRLVISYTLSGVSSVSTTSIKPSSTSTASATTVSSVAPTTTTSRSSSTSATATTSTTSTTTTMNMSMTSSSAGTTSSASGGVTPGNEPFSFAMTIWKPTWRDTCSEAVHNRYSVVGPDGKRYPTWHPPVDPVTGCSFGHEHGKDPRNSDLFGFIQEQYAYDANQNGVIDPAEKQAAGVPFGYANEKLDEFNAANGITNGMRHEDHVGHKIDWANNVEMTTNSCINTPASPGCFTAVKTGVVCDYLMKPHQGTHSQDAFGNNLHEVGYYVACTDGTQFASTIMVAFGKPGEFSEGSVAGGFKSIPVGTFNPLNSPTGRGLRSLPTISRVSESILVPQGQFSQFSQGLYEDWISANYLLTRDGRQLAYYDPHFAVFSPNRFFDPSKPNNLNYSINVCYMSENNGTERARGGECTDIPRGLTYDDPRSPFKGCRREFYFNQTSIANQGGPTAWYTDPYGRRAQPTPFPGAIKQYISSINNAKPYAYESQALGRDQNFCAGVHAPN